MPADELLVVTLEKVGDVFICASGLGLLRRWLRRRGLLDRALKTAVQGADETPCASHSQI